MKRSRRRRYVWKPEWLQRERRVRGEMFNSRFSHWIFSICIPIRDRERTQSPRATHGDLEKTTACVSSRNTMQPAMVIGGRYPQTARLFAPWEFSEYSNERHVRDTVMFFLYFSILCAQFRDRQLDERDIISAKSDDVSKENTKSNRRRFTLQMPRNKITLGKERKFTRSDNKDAASRNHRSGF